MLVNGNFQDTLALNSRGLAYGDGVFETIALRDGRPTLLARHLDRLRRGCRQLGIPDCHDALRRDLDQLTDRLGQYGVLKIMVCRGAGGRGYRPGAAREAQRILSLHPAPDHGPLQPAEAGILAFVCRQRLARQPALAGLKHLNRLEQVLASAEWPPRREVLEGLMLDTEGLVIEGTRSNLFWARAGALRTAELSRCGVAGVAREVLLEGFGEAVGQGDWPLQDLLEADEAFVCNSLNGVWPLTRLRHEGLHYDYPIGPLTREARRLLEESLAAHD